MATCEKCQATGDRSTMHVCCKTCLWKLVSQGMDLLKQNMELRAKHDKLQFDYDELAEYSFGCKTKRYEMARELHALRERVLELESVTTAGSRTHIARAGDEPALSDPRDGGDQCEHGRSFYGTCADCDSPGIDETHDLLSLVMTSPPSLGVVSSWTNEERSEAADWAAEEHVLAQNGDQSTRIEMPKFLRSNETRAVRLTQMLDQLYPGCTLRADTDGYVVLTSPFKRDCSFSLYQGDAELLDEMGRWLDSDVKPGQEKPPVPVEEKK